MSLISIFTGEQLNSEVIDYHTYQFIQAKNLVYPRYNKITLSELDNTYQEQAHLFKSRLVKSVRFEDMNKAKNIIKFLDENIIDIFDRHITFQKHLQMQLYYHAKYNTFNDSFVYTSDADKSSPTYLTQADPKYFYWDKDKYFAYKLVPNAGYKEYEEIGSEEQNSDYALDSFMFVRSGYDKQGNLITGSTQRIAEFQGLASMSDYYANIPYLGAMGGMKVNKLIGTYDETWLENGSNFKNVLQLNGVDPTSPAGKKIIAEYKADFNNKARNGQVYVIANSDPDNKDGVMFKTMQQAQKEDFNPTRDINRDEILAANGLNPTLLGIKTNDSSLTSTSQAEAIKLFKVNYLDNFIDDLTAHYNRQFKLIDPNYDTTVIFDTMQFEDELKLIQIEAQELTNENMLIARGDIKEFNDYRKKRGKQEIEEAAWTEVRSNYVAGNYEVAVNEF